ncbi:MAG: DUF1570 domain-containing protein [Planctomycetota bacterium]
MMNRCLGTVALVVLSFAFSAQVASAPPMVAFQIGGKAIEGLRILHTPAESVVLGTDGQMHILEKASQSQLKVIDEKYKPQSAIEMRRDLQVEYGPRFEVVATRDFLIVQPKGRGDHWPRLFQSTHDGFARSMRTRGVKVRKGNFPLVAVVMPDIDSMKRELRRLKISLLDVAGVYNSLSNRVVTHDSGNRDYVEATVRHETVHAAAYNMGIHSRLVQTPKWICEGLGQMFEPKASTRSGGSRLSDRVHSESIRQLRTLLKTGGKAALAEEVWRIVRFDQAFSSSGQYRNAYATAWAMMFYLSERRPQDFAAMISRTSKLPSFKEYSQASRVKDFRELVGDPHDFAIEVVRFVESL